MSWLEALILGLIQGLTEYLPVSSSGHLAIGSALFGIQGEENLAYNCSACGYGMQYIGDSLERDRLDFPRVIQVPDERGDALRD